eukprot:m.180088 g.180088  ORF g.180088 m.180088 type:complete len:86 (-) comp18409_c0_seq2:90-347(-)
MQVMGYSIRTATYRYTEWFRYNGSVADMNQTVAVELYDHTGDVGDDFDKFEEINEATNPAFADQRREGAGIVRAGWQHQLPPSSM